jgi:hypothetical protein
VPFESAAGKFDSNPDGQTATNDLASAEVIFSQSGLDTGEFSNIVDVFAQPRVIRAGWYERVITQPSLKHTKYLPHTKHFFNA